MDPRVRRVAGLLQYESLVSSWNGVTDTRFKCSMTLMPLACHGSW